MAKWIASVSVGLMALSMISMFAFNKPYTNGNGVNVNTISLQPLVDYFSRDYRVQLDGKTLNRSVLDFTNSKFYTFEFPKPFAFLNVLWNPLKMGICLLFNLYDMLTNSIVLLLGFIFAF